MVASVSSRFAGKVLNDFLKSLSGAVSSSTQSAVYNYLKNKEGATGLVGLAVKHAEPVSKVVGGAAPLAAIPLVSAGQNLLFSNQGAETPTSAARGNYRPPAYASSAYIPGRLPLTNEQAGEMLLDQQRFQHQMQLIQARQNASAGVGTLRDTSGIESIMNLANRIYG